MRQMGRTGVELVTAYDLLPSRRAGEGHGSRTSRYGSNGNRIIGHPSGVCFLLSPSLTPLAQGAVSHMLRTVAHDQAHSATRVESDRNPWSGSDNRVVQAIPAKDEGVSE